MTPLSVEPFPVIHCFDDEFCCSGVVALMPVFLASLIFSMILDFRLLSNNSSMTFWSNISCNQVTFVDNKVYFRTKIQSEKNRDMYSSFSSLVDWLILNENLKLI